MSTIKIPLQKEKRSSKLLKVLGFSMIMILISYTGYKSLQTTKTNFHLSNYIAISPALNPRIIHPIGYFNIIKHFNETFCTPVYDKKSKKISGYEFKNIYTAKEFGNLAFDKYLADVQVRINSTEFKKENFSSLVEKAWDSMIKNMKRGYTFDRSFYQFYVYSVNTLKNSVPSYLLWHHPSQKDSVHEKIFYRLYAMMNNLKVIANGGTANLVLLNGIRDLSYYKKLMEMTGGAKEFSYSTSPELAAFIFQAWLKYFYEVFPFLSYDWRPMSEWYKK